MSYFEGKTVLVTGAATGVGGKALPNDYIKRVQQSL